jgi:glyoxylase-like metal-dependent hydrolase (beta-lactamase superfamily II)
MTFKSLVFGAALALTLGTAHAADLRLWRLDCGSIWVKDLSLFSDTFDYAGRSMTLTDGCYLIRHDDTYMLWDTGLPTDLLHAKLGDRPISATLDRTIPAQLRRIGVSPDRISIVGISHYHFDHVGQAADFPKATLMIGRADFAAFKTTPRPFGLQPDLLAPWLHDGAPVETVTGDKDVFGDGSVVMLAMPGHTPGSHALLVRLANTGPVLLSGDVVHFEEQLKTNDVPPFNTDRAQSLASMDRLRRITATLGATLVVQHDPADIGKLPAFPKSAR